MTERKSDFEFCEGTPSVNFKSDFELSLFNTTQYRSLQQVHWIEFHVLQPDKKRILGSVFFVMEGDTATSPYKAPFGSFELSNKIGAQQIWEFVNFCEKRLSKKGASKIIIISYPELYNVQHHNMLSVALSNQAYSVSNAALGACVVVEEDPLVNRMDKWEKRKLRQAEKAGFEFRPLPITNLERVYTFISDCRAKKNYPLSLSLQELTTNTTRLKGAFQLFGVFLGGELVAASVAVHVNKKVLYNFYSDHNSSFDHLSPIVTLINSMYTWCQRKKIELLDLGTSAPRGKPNFSLIDFKLRLGATPSMKLTFEKKL